MAMADQCGGGFIGRERSMTPTEASRLIIEERRAHARAAKKLREWGSKKYQAREVLALVLEWEGIATKLEETHERE
jgi:hypothetical protein